MNFKTPLKLFLICALLVSGCKSVETSPKLRHSFDRQGIEELQTLRNFFVYDLLELNDKDFYFGFKSKILKLDSTAYNTVKREQITEVLNSISRATYNEIWHFKTEKRIQNSLGTYDYLAPKKGSKFLRFLEKNTAYNSKMREYYDETIRTGDFSHKVMLEYVNGNTIDFDLHDIDIQTILAIHFISLARYKNDQTSSLYGGR